MEFIPRTALTAAQPVPAPVAAAPALDGRQGAIRDIGVAAVAAALGLVEGARTHAEPAPPMALPKAA